VVQRIRRAVSAASTVKSEGWYAMKLAQSLGLALDFSTPRAIFAALSHEVVAFAGMDFERLGEHGVRFGELTPPASESPEASLADVSPALPPAAPLEAR